MKNDFLPIPDAPDYEINSELVVRKVSSGKILKPYHDTRRGSHTIIVNLLINGSRTTRNVAFLRRRAVEAVLPDNSFLPILSTNGKYEINRKGKVRNSRTKKILKPYTKRGHSVHIHINGSCHRISINNLLLETFGITKFKSGIRIPLFLSKGNQRFYFDTLADAARFLADKVFLSYHGVYRYFSQRQNEIYGWRINYQL